MGPITLKEEIIMKTKNTSLFECLPQDKHSQEILKARAELLAKGSKKELTINAHDDYILFTLENEAKYGIIYKNIYEVMVNANITHLPSTPLYVAGVSNIRGHIISIIDLNFLFHAQKSTRSHEVIFIKHHNILLGFLVEKIIGNHSFIQNNLAPSSEHESKMNKAFILGIDQAAIAILNIENIIMSIIEMVDVNENILK